MATLTYMMTVDPVASISFTGDVYDAVSVTPFSGIKPIPFWSVIVDAYFSFVGSPFNGGTIGPARGGTASTGSALPTYYWS